MAELIWVLVAAELALMTTAQAGVLQRGQVALGTPPTTPGEVLDQSTARLGARIPDQYWASTLLAAMKTRTMAMRNTRFISPPGIEKCGSVRAHGSLL